MSMPKVSVIISIYGAEKYIEKCAKSLFEQSLEDIEYIFVNDCSPDASVDILRRVLKEYPQRAGQVRIVNMEQNSGQATVRKFGNSLATGNYVIHCDSDDWVDTDMYRVMYEKAIHEDFDVVICDYYLTDGLNHRYWGQHCPGDPISALLNNRLSASTCNKMVRRSIFERENFVFPEKNICEDFVYNIQYFIYGHKVGFVDKAFYYYYRHSTNSTNCTDEQSILHKFEQIKENIDLGLKILSHNNLEKKYQHDIIRQKLFVKNNLLPIIGSHHSLWESTYQEINSKVLFYPSITTREKIVFMLAYLGLYPLYKKIKK